ncbi:MAG: DUF6265 family protein [Blastocatellales bacterium]
MKRIRQTSLLLTTVLMLSLTALAQERLTEHTFKLKPGEKSPPATIADIAWLAGAWTGVGLGGISEEMWSAPRGGAMLGTYRLIKDDKPVFYELITVVEEQGSLVFRLKHFNPDMTGWEEKDKTVDFPLVAKEKGVIHFRGLSFRQEGEDAMTIFLAIRNRNDGSLREETFRLTRVKR